MRYKCTVLPDTPPEDEAGDDENSSDGEHVYYIDAPGAALATLIAFALDGGMTSYDAEGPDRSPEYTGTLDKPVDYHQLLALARSYVSVVQVDGLTLEQENAVDSYAERENIDTEDRK